jgi:hypothetical protein
MAALGGNPVQHSTMSRTKKIDKQGVFTGEYEVAASTTYEPTGSFQNTGFIVEAGSNYTLTLTDGGELTAGLVTGQVYNVSLKKVVNGSATIVKLLK